MELLNKETFERVNQDFASFEEFEDYINQLELSKHCFYTDLREYNFNPVWYLEDYVTIPMSCLSKQYMDMFEIGQAIRLRKEKTEELLDKRDYVSLLGFVEKCFRMSYLLDLEYELNDSEFMEAFEFVYSTCEYSFEYITQGEIFDRLKSCVNTDKIKLILKKDYEITGNEITIYRGEAGQQPTTLKG